MEFNIKINNSVPNNGTIAILPANLELYDKIKYNSDGYSLTTMSLGSNYSVSTYQPSTGSVAVYTSGSYTFEAGQIIKIPFLE